MIIIGVATCGHALPKDIGCTQRGSTRLCADKVSNVETHQQQHKLICPQIESGRTNILIHTEAFNQLKHNNPKQNNESFKNDVKRMVPLLKNMHPIILSSGLKKIRLHGLNKGDQRYCEVSIANSRRFKIEKMLTLSSGL